MPERKDHLYQSKSLRSSTRKRLITLKNLLTFEETEDVIQNQITCHLRHGCYLGNKNAEESAELYFESNYQLIQ